MPERNSFLQAVFRQASLPDTRNRAVAYAAGAFRISGEFLLEFPVLERGVEDEYAGDPPPGRGNSPLFDLGIEDFDIRPVRFNPRRRGLQHALVLRRRGADSHAGDAGSVRL